MHQAFLAAFLAAGAALAFAPAPRVDEALMKHLLRVVPLGNATEEADAAEEAAEIVRLARLNPGREADIRAILDAGNACIRALDRQISAQVIRAAAAELGPEKIERLIHFYETPEARRLRELAHRVKRGESLKPDEKAALAHAQAAYPLREFGLTIKAQAKALARRGAPSYSPCLDAQQTDLERAGLRTK